jgi:hypothetical protein
VDERRERLDPRDRPPETGVVDGDRVSLLVDERAALGQPQRELERRVAQRAPKRGAHLARACGAELDDEIADRPAPPADRRDAREDRQRQRKRAHAIDPVERRHKPVPAAEDDGALDDEVGRDDSRRQPEREHRDARAWRRLADSPDHEDEEDRAEDHERRGRRLGRDRQVERRAGVEQRGNARAAARARAQVAEEQREAPPREAGDEGERHEVAVAPAHATGRVGEGHERERRGQDGRREHPERRRQTRRGPLDAEIAGDGDEQPGEDDNRHPPALGPARDGQRGADAGASRDGEEDQAGIGHPEVDLARDVDRHKRDGGRRGERNRRSRGSAVHGCCRRAVSPAPLNSCFGTKLHPAGHANDAPKSDRPRLDVKTTRGGRAAAASSAATSTPERSGSTTSRRTTSGARRAASSSADAASAASPTTSSPTPRSSRAANRRKLSWSSTISTRVGTDRSSHPRHQGCP